MMKHVGTYQVFGMGVDLVTIVLGTYFIFHSVIIFFLSLLSSRHDRIRNLFHFPLCDHFLLIINKEIRTDFIEKIEQFHIVTVKFSYS